MTTLDSPLPSHDRAVSWMNPLGNLLRKELQESRGTLIAGVAIYVAMPPLLSVVSYAVSPDEIILGFSAWILLASGWLFSIVVGAQTVCRDWGQPEAAFLLSRPVSCRAVIGAKLLVGLFALAVIYGAGFGLDACLARFKPSPSEINELLRPGPVLTIVGTGLAGFFAAFAVAVLTRQALHGILVAGLVLLVWWTAPLINAHLLHLWPLFMRPTADPSWMDTMRIGRSFPMIVVVFAIGCLLLTAYAARRERPLQLGQKSMAWGIAGMVLALFAAAMAEVGASLPVLDEVRVVEAGRERYSAWTDDRFRRYAVFTARDDWHYAAHTYYYYPDPGGRHQTSTSVFRFRICEDGRLELDLHDIPAPPGGTEPTTFVHLLQILPVSDQDILILGYGRDQDQEQPWNVPGAAHIHWPSGAPPRTVATGWFTELEQPVPELAHMVIASHGRFLYFLYGPQDAYTRWMQRSFGDEPVSAKRSDTSALLIVEVTETLDFRVHSMTSVPMDFASLLHADDGILWLGRYWATSYGHVGTHYHEVGPADDPDTVRQRFEQAATLTPKNMPPMVPDQPMNYLYLSDHEVSYRSEVEGIVAETWHLHMGQSRLVYRASPLAMLFRGEGLMFATLQRLDEVTLLESRATSLTLYDISDPYRLRRTGFFHRPTPEARSRRILSTDKHLILWEPPWLTVLGRPEH